MSGLAGLIGPGASQADVEQLLQVIAHRGPDKTWHFGGAGWAVGACAPRLGDRAAAAAARQDDIAVLVDGEIYDGAGVPVGAAEVLAAYQQEGRTFARGLHGAFACAVVDGGELVLARDAIGVRPLYWGYDGQQRVLFASELKALAGRVTAPRELAPATVYSTAAGVQAYLPVHPRVSVPDAVDTARQELRQALFRATERRLQDGAVGGMLLSGGLDSSIIAAIAHQLQPDLPAFTIGAEDAPDVINARLMAAHLGVEHHVRIITREDIRQMVPRAVYALESFDEDCVSGAIINLLVSEWVSGRTNCILSGEGGDELNGGYLLLKDLPDDDARRRVMARLVEISYNTALQRLDRAMLSNALNYRTPFLDAEVVALCLQLPVRWKIRALDDGRMVEKWLLREAFRDLLPERIYLRQKHRFSGGTGTDTMIESISDELIAPGEFTAASRVTAAGYRLHSPKELHYYRLFTQHFPAPGFEQLVGRWDPGK